MRRAVELTGALVVAWLLSVVLGLGGAGPLGGLLRASSSGRAGSALAAGGAPPPPTAGDAFTPELGLPATHVVAIGASPNEAAGEVWAYGQIGDEPVGVGGQSYRDQWALLSRTDISGWQVMPLPSAPGGEPLAPLRGGTTPEEYGAFAGQATAMGGVVLFSGQNMVVRDPGGQPRLAPAPASESHPPEGSTEPEPELPSGIMLAAGEMLLPQKPGAATLPYAAIADPAHTGVLIAPYHDGANPSGKPKVRPGVLHYDGERWTREPIELPQEDREHFTALALACSSPQSCWLLASFQTASSATSLLLFQRASSSGNSSGYVWKPAQISRWPFGEQLPSGMSQPAPVAPLAQGAQMLTATSQGVWVDFQAAIKPPASNGAQEFSDVSELVAAGASPANALGPWCYPTGPGCERTLGAALPTQYRSFAWPGAGEDPGTRIVFGLPHRAMLELAGGAFSYVVGAGGDTGTAPGAAFASPQQGWIADDTSPSSAPDGAGQAQVIDVGTPAGDQLREESVPFRRPLYAVAQAPGTAPGDPQAPAVAVGEHGQIARYQPGQGWSPESLYDSSGKVQTPTLRGVAWPEPGRIYAVGDNGAMWLWRSETGLWEPDPAKPFNFIGNLQAISFSPGNPSVGYAVGRQGALLKYGKSWEQVPLPPELQQVNFTSVAYAGGEALATYRVVRPDPEAQGAPIETGGIAVEEDGSGLHWHVDTGASALLAQLPPQDSVLAKVAGLPDGGVVAAGPGKVIERDSPSAGWRFSVQPLPEAQNVSALEAYRDPAGPVRAIVSIDLDEQLNPEHFKGSLETSPFKIDVPPPTGAGQPPPFLGPDLLPNSGYMLKETANGWSDMEHQALPASGGVPLDMPIRPDPVLAMLVDPSGASGLAVGGQTGDFEGKGLNLELHSDNFHYQTAAAMRFPAGAASPNGTAPAPVPAQPGQASFVIAGQASCAKVECSDFANENLGSDVWLTHALQVANQIATGSGGNVHAFLYTGGRLPEPGSGNSFARDLSRYAALLGSGGGTLPVYAADSSDLGPFVPGAPSAYYAVDSSGPGGTVKVIVLDFSGGQLEGGQEAWLREQLQEAKAQGVPAIVMGNDALGFTLPEQGSSVIVGHPLTQAANPGALASILIEGEASAYFFDYPGNNVLTTISSGGRSIPAYGTGTLGYVRPPEELFVADSLGSSGFLLASVRTGERSLSCPPRPAACNIVPITAKVVPNISQLALNATDGTLLRRSQVALFDALARRPPAGVAVYSAANGIELAGPDPYDPIPFNCQGPNCPYEVSTEYTFTSSNPDVGDFVAHDPTSDNPRQVELGANKLPIPDSHSGLFCAFNEGTTMVSITTGGLTYSEPVRVLGGSVEYPCGTVPLKNPPRAKASAEATFSPPGLSPAGSPPATPQLQPAPPPPALASPALSSPPPLAPSRPPAPPPPFLPLPQPLLAAVPAIIPPISPTTARPTPPSGTAQVFEPVPMTQKEEEEESAEEAARQFSAYHPGEHGGPGPWTLLLVVLAAGAGATIARGGRPGRRRHPAFARATARGRSMRRL